MARSVRGAALRANSLIQAVLDEIEDSESDVEYLLSSEDEEYYYYLHCDNESSEEEAQPNKRMRMTDQGHSSEAMTYLSYDDEDIQPDVPNFTPTRPVGPQVEMRPVRYGPKPFSREIDFFELFFTPSVIKMLCRGTNAYGDIHILEKTSYATLSDGSWKDVTEAEMQNFLALIIFMGLNELHGMCKYWCQATLYSRGWASRFLSRNRFKAILGMLHIVDPQEEDPSDKLTKIRPLLNNIKQSCLESNQPGRHLSVDERMVPSKGRSGIKQFIPNKPIRFGIKLWCLCDAVTGYTCDFDVYTGRREKPSAQGLGYDVVTRLLESFKNQGYCVYFDNFFTSFPLLEHLATIGYIGCGTTKKSCRGFPDVLRDKEWEKKAERGAMRYQRVNNVLCVQWQDNQPVCVCTTGHSANQSVPVKRHGKGKDGEHQCVTLKKPLAVHEYNQHMGGVDVSDQRLQYYSVLLKSTRWWKTLFLHLLDMSILNAYLLFEAWREQNPSEPSLQRLAGYSHLTFREELVRQMVGITEEEAFPIFGVHRPMQKAAVKPQYAEHMPQVSAKRRNCRVCYQVRKKQVKTSWVCKDCQYEVYLCLNVNRNCYRMWHSSEFDAYL